MEGSITLKKKSQKSVYTAKRIRIRIAVSAFPSIPRFFTLVSSPVASLGVVWFEENTKGVVGEVLKGEGSVVGWGTGGACGTLGTP